MKVTFEEKNNKQYEVQDEHTELIYNDIKNEISKICDKYKDSNRDLIISLMSIESISHAINQNFSNEYGANKIIEIVKAIEYISNEKQEEV